MPEGSESEGAVAGGSDSEGAGAEAEGADGDALAGDVPEGRVPAGSVPEGRVPEGSGLEDAGADGRGPFPFESEFPWFWFPVSPSSVRPPPGFGVSEPLGRGPVGPEADGDGLGDSLDDGVGTCDGAGAAGLVEEGAGALGA